MSIIKTVKTTAELIVDFNPKAMKLLESSKVKENKQSRSLVLNCAIDVSCNY